MPVRSSNALRSRPASTGASSFSRIAAGRVLVVAVVAFPRAFLHDRHVVALVVRSLPAHREGAAGNRRRRCLDRGRHRRDRELRGRERRVRLGREIAHFILAGDVRRAHLDRAALRRVLVRGVLLVRRAGLDDRDEVARIVRTLPRDLDLRARGRCLLARDRSRDRADGDRPPADDHVAGAQEVAQLVLTGLVRRRQLRADCRPGCTHRRCTGERHCRYAT